MSTRYLLEVEINQIMSEYYDYSNIPEFKGKRRWYLEEDHWIDVEIEESGLIYIGTDYTVVSGGGYTAGFQSFEEFLENGPINDMPEDIAEAIKTHLLTHRLKGGAGLLLTHVNELPDLVLWRAFIHLDDLPVKISEIETMGTTPEIIFFDGSLPAGKHTVGFLLIFKKKGKLKETDPLWKMVANFEFIIEPSMKGKKKIQLVTLRDPSGDQVLTQFIEKN